jgi:hypothetical protein
MPAESREQIVVGGTVAALVAADAIAATGRPVALLAPEHGMGGGFAARRHEGRTLEMGVRLLELSFEGDGPNAAAPPLRDYRPGVGGHRAWAPLVGTWVRELVGDRLREIDRPSMVLDGRRVDDVLFTVDLSSLPVTLNVGERRRMLAEALRALGRTGEDAGLLAPRHAARLEGLTLEQASIINHGRRFHERVIAPLCDKVLPGGGASVAASLRRKAWAPLFYPRTLVQALAGEPIGFRPSRPLHTVTPAGCGAVVDALLDRLRAHPGVTITTTGPLQRIASGERGRVELQFADHPPVIARRPVLAVAPGELMAAAGIPYEVDRVRTVVAWLEADAEAAAAVPELLHVLDAGNPVLRVSRGGAPSDPERALLTVEMRHDVAQEQAAEQAARGLVAAGLMDPGTAIAPVIAMARPTFAVPSRETLMAFAAARASFDALELDVELAGGALDVTADTLNDQILHGLRVRDRAA